MRHRSSGRRMTVAYVDEPTGFLAPCGWSGRLVNVDQCEVLRHCSDDEHWDLVAALARSTNDTDHRVLRCRRLLNERGA